MAFSLTARYFILFSLRMMIFQGTTAVLTKNVLHFFTVFNGIFDNFDQQVEEGGNYDIIEIMMKPVLVPQLQKDPAIYLEQGINGKMYRMWVCTVTQMPKTRIVIVTFHNFTVESKYKPRTFNTDSLFNYKREDFQSGKGCEAYFEEIMPGYFSGDAPDCRHFSNGRHDKYFDTFTCDDLRFEAPVGSKETSTKIRYFLKRRGLRYPLIGAPNDYASPCQNSSMQDTKVNNHD